MQSFKQRYLMLFASPYSIQNDNGTKNEGVSVYLVMDDNLTARIDEEAANRGQDVFGIKPVKRTLPYSTASKIRTCPGYYDCTCKMDIKRVDVRGNSVEMPTLDILDIDFVGAVDAQLKKADNKSA